MRPPLSPRPPPFHRAAAAAATRLAQLPPVDLIRAWVLPHLDPVSHESLRLVCRMYSQLPESELCAVSRRKALRLLHKRLFELCIEQDNASLIYHSVYASIPGTYVMEEIVAYFSRIRPLRPGPYEEWGAAAAEAWADAGFTSGNLHVMLERSQRVGNEAPLSFFENPIAVRLHFEHFQAEERSKLQSGLHRQLNFL